MRKYAQGWIGQFLYRSLHGHLFLLIFSNVIVRGYFKGAEFLVISVDPCISHQLEALWSWGNQKIFKNKSGVWGGIFIKQFCFSLLGNHTIIRVFGLT